MCVTLASAAQEEGQVLKLCGVRLSSWVLEIASPNPKRNKSYLGQGMFQASDSLHSREY